MNSAGSGDRHCMVVHAMYPVGETRVQRQAMALTSKGVAVTVISLRAEGEPAHEIVDGVDVIRLPVTRHRGSGMGRQLLEYLSFFTLAFLRLSLLHFRRRFATVQVHNLPDFLVFCALIPKLAGARIVLDLHDLMPEFFQARAGVPEGSIPARIIGLQERWSCRFADHVITVTEGWRQTLADRGVPPEKISVVMNLADPAIFQLRPPPIHEPSEFRILYHGTFARRYGVDLLVEAAHRLRDDVPGIRVRLLGDGELRSALVERIAELELGDVIWMSDGMLDAAELPKHLAWADVGVVPNRSDVFTEGILPTKLLEYVATGVPAVVARTRMVTDYFTEWMVAYFEPGNLAGLASALYELHRDPESAGGLAVSALGFQHENSWDYMLDSYVAAVKPTRVP